MHQVALASEFKAAMRRLAATVSIVSVGSDDHRSGMAATAVMSVCADPPTIVVAVSRAASTHQPLSSSTKFCVNLLAERHRELVGAFGGGLKGQDKFSHGKWAHAADVPVLEDALASLVCEVAATLDVGTHTLFVGRVLSVENHPDIDPLIWVDGEAGRLAACKDSRRA